MQADYLLNKKFDQCRSINCFTHRNVMCHLCKMVYCCKNDCLSCFYGFRQQTHRVIELGLKDVRNLTYILLSTEQTCHADKKNLDSEL